MKPLLKRSLSIALAAALAAPGLFSQNLQAIAPERPHAPILWRPYLAPEVPPVRLNNAPLINQFFRGGNLYLTLQDAIALALSNDIDLEVARYNPLIAQWQLERAQAGGSLPGVPSNATQAFSVASGQGLLGSQAAAGVNSGVNNGSTRGAGNASVAQIGPVAETLDPSIQESTTFSHRTVFQPDALQSESVAVQGNQRVYTASYQEGFLPGTSINVSYNNHYLNETVPTDLLNPSVAPTASITVQQNFLQGFGAAVNERTIRVQRINLTISDLNFRTTLINTVANTIDAYFALVADQESFDAKQTEVETSRQFLEENRKRVELGTLAPLDVTTAESQLAASQQDVVNAQVAQVQDERALKQLISRTGLSDPAINSAHIIALDHIEVPEHEDTPALSKLVESAMKNRPDLQVNELNVKSAQADLAGTKNGVLPILQGFASASNAGLAGVPRTVNFGQGQIVTADKYFVGGIGTALGQVFRRDFPSESAGVFFQAPIRNDQAQADYTIAVLGMRQTVLGNQKAINQVQVDIANASVALQQSHARYQAAVRSLKLQQDLLDAEQKKYGLGASTPYNVIQQRRDLAAARSTQIAAEVSYRNARTAMDQTVGQILDVNHVSVADALAGAPRAR